MFCYSKFKLLLMFNLFYFTGYKIEYKTQDYDYKCSKNKTAIQVNVIVCLQAIP